jgi:hypothetical protein
MEEFREIKEYPKYEVSNHGRVRNKKTQKTLCQRVMIDKHNKPRSCRICIRNIDNIIRFVSIHRLVAITFISNSDNKPIVDHIDRDPTNNHISNLRWATVIENNKNSNHPTKNSRNTSGEMNIYYDKRSKVWIIKYTRDGKDLRYGSYSSLEEAKKAKDSGDYIIKPSKGETHAFTKLKEVDIMEIRVLSGFGVTQQKIAKQFNVAANRVCAIVNGKSWKHVKFLI